MTPQSTNLVILEERCRKLSNLHGANLLREGGRKKTTRCLVSFVVSVCASSNIPNRPTASEAMRETNTRQVTDLTVPITGDFNSEQIIKT